MDLPRHSSHGKFAAILHHRNEIGEGEITCYQLAETGLEPVRGLRLIGF